MSHLLRHDKLCPLSIPRYAFIHPTNPSKKIYSLKCAHQQCHSLVSQLHGYADIYFVLLMHSCLLKTGCSDWKCLWFHYAIVKAVIVHFARMQIWSNYFSLWEEKDISMSTYWYFAEVIDQREQCFHQREIMMRIHWQLSLTCSPQ